MERRGLVGGGEEGLGRRRRGGGWLGGGEEGLGRRWRGGVG